MARDAHYRVTKCRIVAFRVVVIVVVVAVVHDHCFLTLFHTKLFFYFVQLRECWRTRSHPVGAERQRERKRVSGV